MSTPQVGQRPGETATVYAPGVTPPSSTPTRELKGTLGEGLRIAGASGLSKGELKTILGEKNNPGKIISKLDSLNEKLADKGKAGITLKSGAANMLIRKGTKRIQKGGPVSPFAMPTEDKKNKFDFGTGFIGSALTERLGTAGTMAAPAQRNKTFNSGYTPGSGRDAVEATPGSFLAKGMDLGPKGKETVRGVGKQYELPKRFRDDTTVDDGGNGDGNGDGTGDGTITGGGEDVLPITPGPEPIDTSLSSGAGGLDLASWATGFRRARSARQKAGKGAQGLASQKKSPFKSWNA
jgi:hypothetical protein